MGNKIYRIFRAASEEAGAGLMPRVKMLFGKNAVLAAYQKTKKDILSRKTALPHLGLNKPFAAKPRISYAQ